MPSYARPAYDAMTAWGIGLLALVMSLAWTAVVARRRASYGLGAAVLLAGIAAVAWLGDSTGLFARTDIVPSPFVLAVTASIGIGLALAFGKVGDTLVRSMHIESLVALQIFRLPLELLMLRAALLQIMPIEFSLLGYNFDFLTGLGALLIVLSISRSWAVPVTLIWVWNVMGIAFLLVIAALAALTSPLVHAFGTAPAHVNSWVLYFPYALLPLVLVGFAVFGHVLITRKLMADWHFIPHAPWTSARDPW